jgi:hypothetical protein
VLKVVPCLRLLVGSSSVHLPGEVLPLHVKHAGKKGATF